MHQLCECRTVYHSWKHCSFQFSALHLSPFLRCRKPASVRFDSASGLRLGAFACIKNDTGAFSASLRCYLLPEITCESLCSWFEPFHRYNCWAPIDFSNSYLRCGLAPKPARCLNDDTLNTSTCPSETSWCRPAQPCNGTFCVSVEAGRLICDTCRGKMSNSSVLNHKDTRLCLINVFVGLADVRESRRVWAINPSKPAAPSVCHCNSLCDSSRLTLS